MSYNPFKGINYNPFKGINYEALPNYSVTNVPILTYALMGITTIALGYITLKDKELDGSSGSDTISDAEPLKGGKRNKSKTNKSTQKKKH